MANYEHNIEGTCAEGFEEAREAFRHNFNDGWLRNGASFAVFHRGELVVDLWGGWADRKSRRLWKEDTLTTAFSCGKSLAGICMSMLVDRGLCNYSDKVTKYWPEFDRNGKGDITIDMILTHQAGLPYLTKPLTRQQITDPSMMASLIEEETIKFMPGSRTAYHSLTFGWMVDELCRRIDKNHRGMGRFFKEEIADKHSIDVHIGDCAKHEERVATLTEMEVSLTLRECLYDPAILRVAVYTLMPGGIFSRAIDNMRNFGTVTTIASMSNRDSNPETRILGQPAVNAIANARGLARVHQLMMDGRLTGNGVLDRLQTPTFPNEFDYTIGEKQSKGYGFIYTKSPTGSWQVGHNGVGGQLVFMDKYNDIVFAFLTNGLVAGAGDHSFTCNRLTKAVYDCVLNRED